jgi:hypothetical protein
VVEFKRKYDEKPDIIEEYDKYLKLLGLKKKTLEDADLGLEPQQL